MIGGERGKVEKRKAEKKTIYLSEKKESGKRGKRKKNGKRNAVSAQALADTH